MCDESICDEITLSKESIEQPQSNCPIIHDLQWKYFSKQTKSILIGGWTPFLLNVMQSYQIYSLYKVLMFCVPHFCINSYFFQINTWPILVSFCTYYLLVNHNFYPFTLILDFFLFIQWIGNLPSLIRMIIWKHNFPCKAYK